MGVQQVLGSMMGSIATAAAAGKATSAFGKQTEIQEEAAKKQTTRDALTLLEKESSLGAESQELLKEHESLSKQQSEIESKQAALAEEGKYYIKDASGQKRYGTNLIPEPEYLKAMREADESMNNVLAGKRMIAERQARVNARLKGYRELVDEDALGKIKELMKETNNGKE